MKKQDEDKKPRMTEAQSSIFNESFADSEKM